MGDEHGKKVLLPRYPCEEPQRRPGWTFCGRPPRADEGNADGSVATFELREPLAIGSAFTFGGASLERKKA